MKHYTGTKTVKAASMTMGEAYERHLLKEGIRPSECETDKAGYLVEYEGGCQSWSPADVFDRAYRPSETFLDRLRIEAAELEEKWNKCNDFIISGKTDNLDNVSKALLYTQADLMEQYLFILGDRIGIAERTETSLNTFSFGTALSLLKAGAAVRRKGWSGKGLFVVKQIPAHITKDIIPNMQSLPQSAKDILMSRDNPHINYTNQMLIINPDGRADSWVPSSSDVFAKDWQLVTE